MTSHPQGNTGVEAFASGRKLLDAFAGAAASGFTRSGRGRIADSIDDWATENCIP